MASATGISKMTRIPGISSRTLNPLNFTLGKTRGWHHVLHTNRHVSRHLVLRAHEGSNHWMAMNLRFGLSGNEPRFHITRDRVMITGMHYPRQEYLDEACRELQALRAGESNPEGDSQLDIEFGRKVVSRQGEELLELSAQDVLARQADKGLRDGVPRSLQRKLDWLDREVGHMHRLAAESIASNFKEATRNQKELLRDNPALNRASIQRDLGRS